MMDESINPNTDNSGFFEKYICVMSTQQKSLYSIIDEVNIGKQSPDKQANLIMSPCPKYRIDSVESLEPDELVVSPLN